MSAQSSSTTSQSTPAPAGGETPPGELAQFGPNEWLVDEIYQQYLQDPESVDKARRILAAATEAEAAGQLRLCAESERRWSQSTMYL